MNLENGLKLKAKISPYEKLSIAIYQNLTLELLVKNKLLDIDQLTTNTIRTSTVFKLLLKNDVSIVDAATVLIQPRKLDFTFDCLNENNLSSQFVGPLISMIRGKMSVRIFCEKFKITNPVTFHYWEKGGREIPFAVFLQMIDLVTGRLQMFCEAIDFSQDLRRFEIHSYGPNLANRFFNCPWVPTVRLFLETRPYIDLKQHSDQFVAEKLNLSLEQVQSALQTLVDLGVIWLCGTHYKVKRDSFYTPPKLNSQTLANLNNYWLGQAAEFCLHDGLHKIDQASMSFESLAKIQSWVVEMREKVRLEILQSQPETIVQMHWQVFDLLSDKKNKLELKQVSHGL